LFSLFSCQTAAAAADNMSSPAPPIAPAVGGEEDVRAALAEMRRQNEQLRAQAAVDAAQIKALRSVLEDRVQTSPSVKPAADVERLVTARVPTEFGVFDVVLFSGGPDGKLDRDGEVALVYGGFEKIQRDGAKDAPGVLVRVHSSCFTGDVLSSNRCDCGEQLHTSMQMIAKNGSGVLLYLHQEGRGIGLLNKLKAYNLQDQGLDTVDANLALGHPADARDYTVAAKMLGEMGVHSVRLITNNPAKVGDLTERGLDVTERVSIIPVSQNGWLLSHRGRSSPANASGFDAHRDSISSRLDCRSA
jgi:GTP cyclohydrolase II